MIISGLGAQYNLRRLVISVLFPSEVFAGTPTLVIIDIKNAKRFPSMFFKVHVGSPGSGFAFVPFLESKGSRKVSIVMIFPERGFYGSVKLTIMSSFPLGFFSRWKVYDVKEKVIVYPKPLDYSTSYRYAGTIPFQRKNESSLGDAPYEDLVSIRNYVEGDPLKLINWKATAKTGRLKVNEMALENMEDYIIDLRKMGDNVEFHLSYFTGCAVRLITLGCAVGLVDHDRNIPPKTGQSQLRILLEYLALYGKIYEETN